jgi:hypothetical protein
MFRDCERWTITKDTARKEYAPNGTANSSIVVPKRPRRFISLAIAGCLIVRLEIFLGIAQREQCSASGIEVSSLLIPLHITHFALTHEL